MDIKIKSIAHNSQKYRSLDDWQVERGKLRNVKVSKLGNEDYEFAVAIHALIEAWLCLRAGVTQKMVDEFDMNYEKKRAKGDFSEPGDKRDAPYFNQHQFASDVERSLIRIMGYNWVKYMKHCDKVWMSYKK